MRILIVGVGDYDGEPVGEWNPSSPEPFLPLPSVPPAIRQLADTASRLTGWTPLGPVTWVNPGLTELEGAWRKLQEAGDDLDSCEPVIVHFAGHGAQRSGALYLPVGDSDPGRLPTTAVNVSRWLDEVEHTPQAPPTLLLLDVCGAGAAVLYQLADPVADAARRTWVIGACAHDEKAFDARFTKAVTSVLERLHEGRWDISPTLRHVPVETVAEEVQRQLFAQGADYKQTVVRTPRLTALAEQPPFFANPAYASDPHAALRRRLDVALWEIATQYDPVLDPTHFFTRASGATPGRAAFDGCLFSGRHQELIRIRNWLESPDPFLVVTGGPGAGKSSLLGVVVCLAHPELTPLGRHLLSRIDAGHRPARRYAGLVGVHARQRDTLQIIASMAAQLGLTPGVGKTWTPVLFVERIAATRDPVILVCDALDEAVAPAAVSYFLAALLARKRSDGSRACRVLLGRRHTPGGDADELLLDLDVSTLSGQLENDLRRYADDLLAGQPQFSDEALRTPLVRGIGAALKSVPQSAFLLAALYVEYLSGKGVATVEEAAALGERTPRDLSAMLRLHVAEQLVERPWAAHVLSAVAHARGGGMPRDLIHTVVLSSLRHDDGDDRLPTRDEVSDLLADLAYYLRTGIDSDGRRLYRFFHQSLNEYFSEPSSSLPTLSVGQVFAGLLDVIPRAGGTPDGPLLWELASPYLLRHLPDHAVDSAEPGALDRLLLDPGFLARADPAGVSRHHSASGSRSARRAAQAHLWSAHPGSNSFEIGNGIALRAEVLPLNLTRLGMPVLAQAVGQEVFAGEPPVWWPLWATGRVTRTNLMHVLTAADAGESPDDSSLSTEDAGLDVTALALGGEGDAPIVALGDSTGRIRLFLLLQEGPHHLYDTSRGHEKAVRHVLFAEVEDASLIVTCCDRERMCVCVGPDHGSLAAYDGAARCPDHCGSRGS
ncbi:caspase family protein [Streptomyces scopuliridis]|uniref:nSTAND1 domain-containing NTPase n=1 Tax=Streptomyces scopuliridis TaxID=452529 RepID=UPI001058081B|nr:caspase family protein [Streptomyces scopuliridis]